MTENMYRDMQKLPLPDIRVGKNSSARQVLADVYLVGRTLRLYRKDKKVTTEELSVLLLKMELAKTNHGVTKKQFRKALGGWFRQDSTGEKLP